VLITGTDAKKTLGFVGSHMDVVPANPESWERDPFKITIEGDKLYGRGACGPHSEYSSVTLALWFFSCVTLTLW
jgi:hypothetical protein